MMVERGEPLFPHDRIWTLHTRGWVVGVNELSGCTSHADKDIARGLHEIRTALALLAKRARVALLDDPLLLRALAHRY